MPSQDAAMESARLRFRPILMTAFAFILGVRAADAARMARAPARRTSWARPCSGACWSPPRSACSSSPASSSSWSGSAAARKRERRRERPSARACRAPIAGGATTREARRARRRRARTLLAGCTVGPDYKRPESIAAAAVSAAGPITRPALRRSASRRGGRSSDDPVLQGLIREAVAAELRPAVAAAAHPRGARAASRSRGPSSSRSVSGSRQRPYTHIVGNVRPPAVRRILHSSAGSMCRGRSTSGALPAGHRGGAADLLRHEEAKALVMQHAGERSGGGLLQSARSGPGAEISRQTLAGARSDSLKLVQLREQGGVAALIDVRQAESPRRAGRRGACPTPSGSSPRPRTRSRSCWAESRGGAARASSPGSRSPCRRCRRASLRTCSRVGRISSQAEQQLIAANGAHRRGEERLTSRASSSPAPRRRQAIGSTGVVRHRRACSPSVRRSRCRSSTAGARRRRRRRRRGRAQEQLRSVPADRDPGVPRGSDALVEYQKSEGVPCAAGAARRGRGDAARLATLRYKGGVTSYLEVLDSERQQLDAELQLART